MAININKKEGDKLHAEEWNELAQEVMGKQPRLNIVDDLNSDSSVDVLSAKQGKILDEKINSATSTINGISEKVNKLPTGYYYGQFDSVSGLPDASRLTQKGYAYVASEDPSIYYIYLFDGEGSSWEDSGNKFVTTALEDNLSTKSESKAPTTKVVAEGIEGVDLTKAKTTATELTSIQKYNANANISNRIADVEAETGVVKSLGYKVLNPNLSFAEQVTAANTIYEVKDEFDLNNSSVTIPANCTLKFNGGKIANGNIVGNHTIIDAPEVQIFAQGVYKYKGYSTAQTTSWNTAARAYKVVGSDVVINGTWDNESPKAEWVGLLSMEENVDASPRITNFIKLHANKATIKLPKRVYGIFSQINIAGKVFDAQGATFNLLAVSDVYDDTIEIPVGGYPLNLTMFPQGIAPINYIIYVGHNGQLYNLTIDGANITYAADGTYYHTNNGVYGLVGALGKNAKVIDCTIKNSYQNGILDINHSDFLIKGTTIQNCVEHCIYGRPTYGGKGLIENCLLDTWYIHYNPNRDGANSIKIVQNNNIETNSSELEYDSLNLTINNCIFRYNGDSNPRTTIYAGAKTVLIKNCDFSGQEYRPMFNFSEGSAYVTPSGNATKVCYVTFENCTNCNFALNPNNTNAAVVDFYNCKGLITDVFQFARNIVKSEINCRYNLSDFDYRYRLDVVSPENRILNVKDSEINGFGEIVGDALCNIYGAYDVVFENVKLKEDFTKTGSSATFRTVFKTNSTNTELTEAPTIKIINSDFSYEHMDTPPIVASRYDVTLIDSVFSAKLKTGYSASYKIFSSYKTIKLINAKSIPYKNDTAQIVNIASTKDATKIIYPPIDYSINGIEYEAHGVFFPPKGSTIFDPSLNKPFWWGDDWVEYDGETKGIKRQGLSTQRPIPTNIGFKYFDTTLGKPIFWNGFSWIDGDGDYIFDNSGTLQNRLALTSPVKGQQFKLTREGETDVYLIYGSYGWLKATDGTPWFDDSGTLNTMYDKYNYTLLTAEPSNWSTAYNTYYKIVDGVYTKLNALEPWASDTYYKLDVNAYKGIQVKLTDTDTELLNKVVKWNGTKYINIVDNTTLKAGTPTITFTTENNTTTAAITSTSSGKIYYTKNGNAPTSSSTEYSSAITLADGDQVKAICIRDHMDNSAVGFVKVATPVITFNSAGILTITCDTSDVKIYYTVDGSTPDTSSTEYDSSASITIAKNVTVKAFAVLIGRVNSEIASKKRS